MLRNGLKCLKVRDHHLGVQEFYPCGISNEPGGSDFSYVKIDALRSSVTVVSIKGCLTVKCYE